MQSKWALRLAVFNAALTIAAIAAKIGDWKDTMAADALVIIAVAVALVLFGALIFNGAVWVFGRHGELERLCKRRIKTGVAMLSDQSVESEQYLEWREGTITALMPFFGGDPGHEEIERFEQAALLPSQVEISSYEPTKRRIRQHLGVLTDLRKKSQTREIHVFKVK